LGEVIAQFVMQIHDTGEVTACGVETQTQQQPQQAASGTDPWNGQPTQAPAATGAATPTCVHGPLKVVPAGFSQAKQKAYAAFWSCQAPRGQQCRLDQRSLPAIPA
jgi:hypothetical protein